ncbi:expressed unknown protein [Ectocarpus siliculosus]|uniref:Uncharacterized protein n=1 Tax=Ectocarpus siliculosus TaxID=2880 RepID=D7FWD6_ECTSI|nr:expressed unknown protein [Ectocarpus siliculosus]|eukprot:CBJ32024.1 expressed unknown protein [Ectocarpus siliculosus]
MDNAVTLVGLAGWDVLWQMRGLALSRPPPMRLTSPAERAERDRQALKLTMGPRRGIVACNGRAGHVQFYNVGTNCLEASAEVVRFNRDTSAKSWQSDHLSKMQRGRSDGGTGGAGGAGSVGPVVEHVAFSSDGKRMVAVASRAQAASPSLSFWKHARGSDPFGSNNGGYTGSYAGARNSGGGGGGGRGGGTSGHWAADTSVENPHGAGNAVAALEYHPRENVVVTAGKQDGGFNLWGLRRTDNALESLAAAKGGGGVRAEGEGEQAVHWACSLSVRYKEGLAATGVSFSSDGSVLAVAYSPTEEVNGDGNNGTRKGQRRRKHSTGQGVITLWSLETATLLSTLLPPRTQHVRFASPKTGPLKCLGFIAASGRIMAAGSGYAAVWDMVSPEPTPLWEYRAHVRAAATADPRSVVRCGKAGVSVEGRGVGDVALCVDAASLGGEGDGPKRGSVVLLLNSGDPTPLHTWRLPGDTPTSMRLLLGSGGGREGVLCLTQRGELLMLSVAGAPSTAAGRGEASVPRPRQQQVASGVGVLRMKHGASAPALHLSAASKRALLAVDLAASDPALASGGGGKRLRVSTATAGGDDGEEEEEGPDVGHAGGREALLRSGQRVSDILDPSTINLAPVPDMYQAFMSTLVKPAPLQQQQKSRMGGAPFDNTLAGGAGSKPSKGRGRGHRGGDKGLVTPPSVVEEGLLSMLAKKLKT